MKTALPWFLFSFVFSFVLNGCSPNQPARSPTETHTATMVLRTSTSTPVLPTLTSTPLPSTTPSQVIGKTIVVFSREDSGPGTLRQALLDAESGDKILFDQKIFPPDNPTTIFLTAEDQASALPEITQGKLVIDASDGGVILDGSMIKNDWSSAFKITSSGNIIQGFTIINFLHGAGFEISSGAQQNLIGGDPKNGTGPTGQSNLIGNGAVGISIGGEETSFNVITGNLIGVNRDGERLNIGSGIYIEDGANHNKIGPNNIVAYAADGAINVVDSATISNTITTNNIYQSAGYGINISGSGARPGGNRQLSAPEIIDFDLAQGMLQGISCANCRVEIYSDKGNQGEIFESFTNADANGNFILDVQRPLAGPHLTAINIDEDGNTSGFSIFISGMTKHPDFQQENPFPKTEYPCIPSDQSMDNRLGGEVATWDWKEGQYNSAVYQQLLDSVFSRGLGWVRLNNWSPNPLNWQTVLRSPGVYSIPKDCDDFISTLANHGIKMVLNLGAGAGLDGPEHGWWGNPGWGMLGDREPEWWFKTQEERDRYVEFTRFMVEHFKGRIQYYEIWNEADSGENPGDPRGGVRLSDYILLIKQVAPVIKEIDPDAKVVAGAVGRFYKEDRPWLLTMLQSGTASLVDAISWHPFYGESPLLYSGRYPEHPEPYYWRDYPANVQAFKRQAAALGFHGEYMAEEMVWRTTIDASPNETPTYPDIVAAKYLSRATIMQLGLGGFVMVGSQIPYPDVTRGLPQYTIVCNLAAIMAGSTSEELQIDVRSDAKNVVHYNFILPNGDRLIVLWNDGAAVDEDPGIPSTVIIPRFGGWKATGIDVLNGFEQKMNVETEKSDLIINDFLLKDYPIFIRMSKDT